MGIEHITVGVVVARKDVDNPWIDHVWVPVAVLPDAPDMAPGTVLSREPGETRLYLGPATLGLYPSDTGHLIENFLHDYPRIWVCIRPVQGEPPVELIGVTVDSSEGEGFADGMGDIVEALPMPALVAERVVAFYRAHHVERPFFKRQRDKTRPDSRQRENHARELPGGGHPKREGGT